jgi:hypothetical protein
MLLKPNRQYRPTAQEVVDRLSDLDVLLSKSSLRTFVSCQGPEPCTGLSNIKSPTEKFPALAGRQVPPFLAEYLNPWMDPSNWGYSYWNNMDMDIASIEGRDHDVLDFIVENIDVVAQSGGMLRDRACKTGTTKHFWEAHKAKVDNKANADHNKDREASAGLILLKHVVFTRLTLPSYTGNSRGWLNLQTTLLPICLLRSDNYGSFYCLMSYPLHGPALDESYDAHENFMNLTTGDI